jgi:ribonucleoside-diphosphate reductase alpha chain
MTDKQMIVIKRNGQKERFELDKWQAQIAKVCEGVADVSPSMIEIAAQAHFTDGMSTRELDQIALRSMVNLIDEEENPDTGNVNYQYVAGKQRISMLRKDVYGTFQPPHLFDLVKKNVGLGLYTPELLEWYTEEEWNKLNSWIDHEKDEELPYAAVEQLIEKYLVRNRSTGLMVESPQVRYMVAAATAFHAEKKDRLKWVRDFYEASSDGMFTLATPVLAGLGTKTKQFSSCVLLKTDDSLKSIFATGQVMADYAAKRAGIGLEIGRMRPLGAAIRGGEVMHTGILPFMKKWFADLRSCSQGGVRNASATVNLPIWHYQFDDFIVMKNNKGTEETRVRQMDYCVVMSAFFWRRFAQKGTITFFDPNEVPDLYEAFYAHSGQFEELYTKYEKRKDLRTKTLPAEDVIKQLLTERGETGRYYLLNIDNVSNQGPFDTTIHPIYQTNLCTEIMQHTRPFQTIDDPDGRIALCTLGSANWGKFRHPEEMRRPLRLLHRCLHNLLQYQDFLSVHSEMHNKEFEPLGIGITNLAYWHAKRKMKYGSEEALGEVKRWMEHQAFYLTEMSVDLAEEKGKCLESDNTWYGRGVFPWERRAKGVNELTDFTPSEDLNWEGVRARMIVHGVRNATTMAIAPVESSSVVLTSTNGVNLLKQLIVIKESKAGAFVQVAPEYRKLKNHYQLLWDQPDCIGYIKTIAVLQVFIDQGISADTWYSGKFFRSADPELDGKVPITLIAKNLMLAHKWGVKSFYYDLRDKQSSREMTRADDFHAKQDPLPIIADEGEDYCESCTL